MRLSELRKDEPEIEKFKSQIDEVRAEIAQQEARIGLYEEHLEKTVSEANAAKAEAKKKLENMIKIQKVIE